MNIKDIIKIDDPKIVQRKISIYNVLNDANYSLNDLGIFECRGYLNYYGIPFDEIKFSKLKEYKRNYSIIKRWMVWILNNCEVKKDQKNYPGRIYFFYKNKFILEQNLKNKVFWVSNKKITLKIKSKFNYNYLNIRYLLNSILEDHFNCKGFTTRQRANYKAAKLEDHFNCKGFTTTIR